MARVVAVFAAILIPVAGVLTPRDAHAGATATLSHHANLGFRTSQSVSVDTGVSNPPCQFSFLGACIFHAAVAFSGTIKVGVTLGEDTALSYDPSDLNANGGPFPVGIKYTPTPNGSMATYSVSGTLTLNFDGCSNCPAVLPVSGTSAPVSFTAPMGSDPPVSIPGSSTPITLSVGGTPIITASIGSTLTLAPAPAGTFPGLGGAAALVSTTGATGAPLLPIEWDSAGSTQTVNLTTPASPSAIGISLSPMMHWVGTSGSAEIDLHWTSQFQDIVSGIIDGLTICALPFCVPVCSVFDCSVSDPSPINVFSGSLGPVFTSLGLDTLVGNAVGPPAGSLVAARIAAGFVPIPLTSPEGAVIPPISLGAQTFNIPTVSISGTPSGAVLSGDSVTLMAVAGGGTAPFTYAWTKNGAPFATTQTITDTPALGDTTYGVTVSDSGGAVSNTATTVVHDYDFTVSGSPSSLQTLTSGSNDYAITEALAAGSSSTGLPSIGLSVTGLPSGASPGFAPASGNASGFTSTLTITTANAPAGVYGLTLVGTDGRPSIGGSRSSGLTLTILTPAQAIPGVIATVNSLQAGGTLNGGQANSFLVKLNHAIGKLNAGQPSTACNQLQAFVNEVTDYVAQGILTPAQAATLLSGPLGVVAIMAAIPC